MLLRLLSRIGSWFQPQPTTAPRLRPMLEPLESRIAPAAFVTPHLVTYTDAAGRTAFVGSTAPIFTKTNFNSVLTFVAGTNSGTQQLESINLGSSSITTNVLGDNITVAAAGGGANVGAIESNAALGHIVVQGNLGYIQAGALLPGNSNYIGLTSLSVTSLGTLSGAPPTPNGEFTSTIAGSVGAIAIQQNMTDAAFVVNSNTGGISGNGGIGSLFIGGSLFGGSDSNGGYIKTDGSVGSIHIVGDLQGGAGANSGALNIGGGIGAVSINNVFGYTMTGDMAGLGQNSGSIMTGTNFPNSGAIGSLTIRGSLTGGDGNGSGEISQAADSPGVFGMVTVGGSIRGGTGDNSGEIHAAGIGSISVGQGLTGSSGTSSGSIFSDGNIGSLSIPTDGITGGTNTDSGAVIADGAIGSAVIHGDIAGVSGAGATIAGTGQVQADSINSFTLYGSLVGNASSESGSLVVSGNIGHATLIANKTGSAGSLLGGTGTGSGGISAAAIGSVSIAGEVMGSGASSGSIIATGGPIGSVAIFGAGLLGGAGASSGQISASLIHSVYIAGQLMGSGANTGSIISSGAIGSVTIGHGIIGGSGDGSGDITTNSGSGFGDNLGSLNIAGGITGAGGNNSGQVAIGGSIGAINLHGGALTGAGGTDSGAILATDNIYAASIGSIIGGSGGGSGQLSTGGNLVTLDITGGASATAVSGVVNIAGSAQTIAVHGDIAGAGDSTGLFLIGGGVEYLGVSGALRGGAGIDTGSIFTGLDGSSGIGHAYIGDIIGGGGQSSGAIVSYGNLGAITVGGAAPGVTTHGIIGGAGPGSGQIFSSTSIKSIGVNGLLKGGSGSGSGSIVSNTSFQAAGDIQGDVGAVYITGSVLGGAGPNSGQLSVAGNAGVVSIGGDVTGSAVSGSGAILAGVDPASLPSGNITFLKIGGTLQGADIPASTGTVTGSGYVEAGHIGAALIGSIQSGTVGSGDAVTDDGAILSANDIATLVVTGSVAGNTSNPVEISALGQSSPGKTDLAFGNIVVGHDVAYTNFLAGYDQTLSPVNGAASINQVVIGGDWSASNLIAGAEPVTIHGPFGQSMLINQNLVPTIASIIIKGQVESAMPTPGPANTYGFVSGKIEAFSLHGVVQSVAFGQIDPVGESVDTILSSLA